MKFETKSRALRGKRLADLVPGQHFWIVPWSVRWDSGGQVAAHRIDKDTMVHHVDSDEPFGTADLKVIYKGDSLVFDASYTKHRI